MTHLDSRVLTLGLVLFIETNSALHALHEYSIRPRTLASSFGLSKTVNYTTLGGVMFVVFGH